MNGIASQDSPNLHHSDDVTNEDNFVRISKEIAEEIINAQSKIIILEQQEDKSTVQHEIELLTRQVTLLEARKAKFDESIKNLQKKLRHFNNAKNNLKSNSGLPTESKKPAINATTSLIDSIRLKNSERALSSSSQLPLWPEPMRGVPNGILRSALFGAIKRGKRRYVERVAIASIDGVSITYSGPRLDQSDLDVWEGALHLARLIPLGDKIEFTEKGFLRLIGRGGVGGENIGKSDREWLRKSLTRLSANNVELTQGPYGYGGSLIDEYFRDESTGRYILILNPRLKAMFGRDGWTQVDWSIRQALRGHPLAQWLHGFYSTHAAPFPLKVETLHKLCGSETGEDAKTAAEKNKALLGWREDSLIPALNALVKACDLVGQSFTWEVANGDLVNVSRDPSRSQLKHLRQKAIKLPKPGKYKGDRTRTRGG
ncbi:MAG: hypothetical protein E6Q84_04675 [Thiothrix sp.]|nr:MAG: hypothetical protein E6Q84_04675 [Thiothrix sp.]